MIGLKRIWRYILAILKNVIVLNYNNEVAFILKKE